MTESRARTAITSSGLSAEIDPLGAQLFAMRDADGRDLLWDGDPAVWTGRAPILFPIVGMLEGGEYRLDGAPYQLAKHGFARNMLFSLVEATASSAVFRLVADEKTLAVYPFRFELDLTFSLAAATLTMTATIRNLGDGPMPASFGLHPALRWPLPYGQPRAEHAIRFETDEPAPIRRVDSEGLVKPEPFATPVEGRELILRDDLFVNDAVIFDQLNSDQLIYGAASGPRLELQFKDTPYLGVWTKPGAGYICIEPWHGIADPVGYAGDFRDKPGVFELAPGAARDIAVSITLKV